MTKKNLKPQQAAPVQREINTTSSESGMGLTPYLRQNVPPIINSGLAIVILLPVTTRSNLFYLTHSPQKRLSKVFFYLPGCTVCLNELTYNSC